MNRLWLTGFIIFATVFAGLLLLEVTGGLISDVFPITLWFWLTVVFAGAAIVTSSTSSTSLTSKNHRTWTAIALGGTFTLLLVIYAIVNAWRFGPFGVLLILVAAVLPLVIARSVINSTTKQS